VTKKSPTSGSKKKPSKSAASKKSSKNPKPDDTSAPAYASAGVDLDHDEGFISEIAEITRPTMRPEILSSIGGFAGLFKAPDRYKEPVFVAGADGVGTKLKLAAELGRYDTVGIDCVAMVVNDLIVQGAEPIVFLDYMAMNQLDPDTAKEALRGISDGEIELVGFGVGVVERDQIVDGSGISHGDVILGFASSGFHSNGYSLVRKVVEAGIKDGQLEMRAENPELNTSLAAALMTPTRIYVKPILNLVRDFDVKGIAHITGGGFEGNLPRVLPNGVQAQIDPKSWPRPPIFDLLQRIGGISDEEMLRVFNCGIGMVAIVPPEQADEIIDRLSALSERAYPIGTVEAKGADEPTLVFGPRAASGD